MPDNPGSNSPWQRECDSLSHAHKGIAENELYLGKIFFFQKTCPLSFFNCKGRGKSVPLLAWSGPEGSGKLRFPDFMTTAQDGGKVVSLTHRPPLPPGNAPGTHFC